MEAGVVVSKITGAMRVSVARSVLKNERGVMARQARLRIPGRRCTVTTWVVENNRTGATSTFDKFTNAEAFFEKEAGRNASE